MGMQVRIERTRSVMREQRGGKIASAPVFLCSTSANPSGSKRLELVQRRLHRPRMSIQHPRVLAEKSGQ